MIMMGWRMTYERMIYLIITMIMKMVMKIMMNIL